MALCFAPSLYFSWPKQICIANNEQQVSGNRHFMKLWLVTWAQFHRTAFSRGKYYKHYFLPTKIKQDSRR